ncbi:MAG: hypothetical protein C0428_17195 [Polaromonas sp.]|nr:hypothetical protein [Polaromonas sp.]
MVAPSDISNTPFGSPPRPLTEHVLQSAEEAVLANPASVETLQDGAPGLAHPAAASRPRDRLARIVGDRPLQSALAALLAGALLAALVKAALSRRRH